MLTFLPGKKFVAAAAFVLALTGGAVAAQAELTRAEVEKIVEEYIGKNGGLILQAVQNHQDTQMRENSRAAIQNNTTDLYFDAGTPMIGNPEGDVTIVEFFDYNCGYCKKALPALQSVLDKDKNVRILFKEYPILGETSETAAKWALAAHKQGKYFEYHRALMQNNKKITDGLLVDIAEQTGLDLAQAKRDVTGTEILLQIERNRALAANMDIRGTPAFIIGDNLVPGAIPPAQMEKMIADHRKTKSTAAP